MLPDLVRHPSFLIFKTFLSNVRDDLFLREHKVSLSSIHTTHLYLSVCHILIVLQANAMPLSTNNYIYFGKSYPVYSFSYTNFFQKYVNFLLMTYEITT